MCLMVTWYANTLPYEVKPKAELGKIRSHNKSAYSIADDYNAMYVPDILVPTVLNW